jgi:hypothetical protein
MAEEVLPLKWKLERGKIRVTLLSDENNVDASAILGRMRPDAIPGKH